MVYFLRVIFVLLFFVCWSNIFAATSASNLAAIQNYKNCINNANSQAEQQKCASLIADEGS